MDYATRVWRQTGIQCSHWKKQSGWYYVSVLKACVAFWSSILSAEENFCEQTLCTDTFISECKRMEVCSSCLSVFFLTSLHVMFFMFKCDGKTAESSRNLIRTHTEDIEIYFFKSLDQYNSRHAVSFWIDAVQKTVWRRLVRTADEQWTRVRESWLVDELQMWNLLSSGGESKWQLDSMSELYMWSSSAWNKDGY